MAGKTNVSVSQMDKTSFFWVANCSVCHPGGGAAEFDRDGKRYWDPATGKFGYEALGKAAAEVTLDGDYAFFNPMSGTVTGTVPARWDLTGVSEPDCLYCHRTDRTFNASKVDVGWINRAGTLRGATGLKDDAGNAVASFAAASTAGQGWFSSVSLTAGASPPLATKLQIDYAAGVSNGSLAVQGGFLHLAGTRISKRPPDMACWGCHSTSDLRKRGRTWFDPALDVHYAGLNNLRDLDPTNDIAPGQSTGCTYCHPAGKDHQIVKGRSFAESAADELDFVDLKTCRDCHDPASTKRDARAPAMAGALHDATHLGKLSCQACHVPFITAAADLVVDNALTGSTVLYQTKAYLSTNAFDPAGADKTYWLPAQKLKKDADGKMRLFPEKPLLSVWWGDWNQNGTPSDRTDDVVQPIPLWRVRYVISANNLAAAVTDDDGKAASSPATTTKEVNRLAEILPYLQALKGNDSAGNPVASNPVLVKGGKVYHLDAGQPGGVGSFEIEGSGCAAESSHAFSLDHNVLPKTLAIGACALCHRWKNGGNDTAFFDRKVLVDPFDANGKPVYKTVREMTGVSPR